MSELPEFVQERIFDAPRDLVWQVEAMVGLENDCL
jgi:hypothetical protein